MKIYRQGDVLIKRIKAVPQNTAKVRESGILAFGEVTGHCHRVARPEAATLRQSSSTKVAEYASSDTRNLSHGDFEVLEIESGIYLRVGAIGCSIIHDEHNPIVLPAGNYEITIQREYSPEAIRNVAD
jgi:hypothetical protein